MDGLFVLLVQTFDIGAYNLRIGLPRINESSVSTLLRGWALSLPVARSISGCWAPK